MPMLEVLRNKMPDIKEIQMQADGYCVWQVWSEEKNTLTYQTMEDYGGIQIVESEGQSLWFFFSTEVYLAIARLSVWSRYNKSPMFWEAFPCRIHVNSAGEKKLIFDEALWKQNVNNIDQFSVWLHPALEYGAYSIVGLSVENKPLLTGMTELEWKALNVDSRLPYQSNLGWYVVLRPIGNTSDRTFQVGWRDFYSNIEVLLQRNKFHFTLNNFFLIFPLESLRQLRTWCQSYIEMIMRIQEEKPDMYWPCVMAIIERKNLPFNEDLANKVGLDWGQLTPDFPHMPMRSALMLGDEFIFHMDRFAPATNTSNDWCSISLNDKRFEHANILPHLVSSMGMGYNPYCFYCGQRGHKIPDCPTRAMPPRLPKERRQITFLDFSELRSAVTTLERAYSEKDEEAFDSLYKESSHAGILYRAIYGIGWAAQLRSIPFFWKARDKNLSKNSLDDAGDDSPVYHQLRAFISREPVDMEKELTSLAVRLPHDFRICTLRGFVALEKGNPEKAMAYWKEAEVISTYPVVSTWHLYLQGRCYEYMGDYAMAMSTYQQVFNNCPTWNFVLYRIIVCDIKSGFLGRALPLLLELIQKDGNFFNIALMDAELERGYIQLLNYLNAIWENMQSLMKEETIKIERLLQDLPSWFSPDSPFLEKTKERVKSLMQMATIKNYVTLQALGQGRLQIEKDIQSYILEEGKKIREAFKSYANRLEEIRDEAAWFPFPKALIEFNKKYNESVASYNWVIQANLKLPESFKRAEMLIEQQRERSEYLEGKINFLRVVRDSTLFLLSLLESFFWIEIVGTVIVFVLLPLLLVYGNKFGFDFTSTVLAKDRWQVQKTFFFFASIFSLIVACLRTVIRFEKVRDKVFKKAREEAESRAKGRKQK